MKKTTKNDVLVYNKTLKEKNKTLLSITAVLTAGFVFTTTAFVALAQNAGYEIYKNSLIKFATADNYTMDTTTSLIYNDTVLFSERFHNETDQTTHLTQTFSDAYPNGGEIFYSDSEGYMSLTNQGLLHSENTYNVNNSNYTKPELSDSYVNLINAGIDTIVGDIKNHVVTEGNTVFVSLTEEQIPALPQAFLAFLSEEYKRSHLSVTNSISLDGYNSSQSFIPVLTSDHMPEEYKVNYDMAMHLITLDNIAVKSIEFVGEFDDSRNLKSLYCLVEIGGTTEDGAYDSAFLELDIKINNYGTTVIEKPTYTGYSSNYYYYNSNSTTLQSGYSGTMNTVSTYDDPYMLELFNEDWSEIYDKGYAGELSVSELQTFILKHKDVVYAISESEVIVRVPQSNSFITVFIVDEDFVSVFNEAAKSEQIAEIVSYPTSTSANPTSALEDFSKIQNKTDDGTLTTDDIKQFVAKHLDVEFIISKDEVLFYENGVTITLNGEHIVDLFCEALGE